MCTRVQTAQRRRKAKEEAQEGERNKDKFEVRKTGRDRQAGNWLSSVQADSHYTSRFRSVAERHRSVKFSHVQLNGDVHTDRKVSVTSQVRSIAFAELKS